MAFGALMTDSTRRAWFVGAGLVVVGLLGLAVAVTGTELNEVATAPGTTGAPDTTTTATPTTTPTEPPAAATTATTEPPTAAELEAPGGAALGDCAVNTWLSEVSVDIDPSCVKPFPWDDWDWPIVTCDTATGAVVLTSVLVVSPALDALYLVNDVAQAAEHLALRGQCRY